VTSNPFDVVYAPLDHVAFAPIADQVIGRPFTITLTARDALSLTVLYTGTAILGDTTGTLALVDPGPCSGTLALRCAGPFVEGVWSGQVIITQPHPTAVIEAASGDAIGSSNSFTIWQRTHLPILLRDA
jgi:hypothetical protein